MRILVTGASGFLGSYLCGVLLKEGHEVIGIGRTMPPPDCSEFPRFSWMSLDLVAGGIPPECLEGVDALIHLAAILRPSVGADEASTMLCNEVMALHVFRSACGRVKRIIHASSQMVYGDPGSLAVDETFPLNGWSTAYGTSKLNSEHWLRYFQAKHGGQAVILRFSGFLDGADSVINHLTTHARAHQPLELFSEGTVCRDYLTREAAVRALITAMHCTHDGVAAYNIGSGQAVSTSAMAQAICEVLGSNSQIVLSSQRALRSHFVFNISKACTELGFEPPQLIDAIRHHARNSACLV